MCRVTGSQRWSRSDKGPRRRRWRLTSVLGKALVLVEGLEGGRTVVARVWRMLRSWIWPAEGQSDLRCAPSFWPSAVPRTDAATRMHVPHLCLGNTQCCPGLDVRSVGGVRELAKPRGRMGSQEPKVPSDTQDAVRKRIGRQKSRGGKGVPLVAPGGPGRCLA